MSQSSKGDEDADASPLDVIHIDELMSEVAYRTFDRVIRG